MVFFWQDQVLRYRYPLSWSAALKTKRRGQAWWWLLDVDKEFSVRVMAVTEASQWFAQKLK
ncbi:hypothetical protein M23134_06538 [Microscilla marina ATCC 23134]|uniref:Uncharacterized protein n=1 Tax=Microscilla marina ATCC 23134 TaxID=313606 RepID=A1ZQS3_MICM2|nr:hypothetical protein M23134_06538 [Microscilla marina ATCC 23134]